MSAPRRRGDAGGSVELAQDAPSAGYPTSSGRAPRGGAISQLVRYVIVAGLGYGLAVAVYALELRLGVPEYPAVVVVFVLNGLFNFVGVRLWAFPPSGQRAHRDLGRFAAVACGSLVINYTAFFLMFSVLDVPAVLAQAVAIAVAAPFGFLANRLWSFRAR